MNDEHFKGRSRTTRASARYFRESESRRTDRPSRGRSLDRRGWEVNVRVKVGRTKLCVSLVLERLDRQTERVVLGRKDDHDGVRGGRVK
jgi:hypothetical protein